MNRRFITLAMLLGLTSCTSAEEKARQREQAMMEQARADSAAEADFIADSTTLASTITVDSIRELRIRDVSLSDEDGNEIMSRRHEAVGRFGLVCGVDMDRYATLIVGDTLRCQWGPAQ